MVQKGICDKRAHFKMELISNKPNQSKIKILQPHHEIFVTQQGNFKIDYFFPSVADTWASHKLCFSDM